MHHRAPLILAAAALLAACSDRTPTAPTPPSPEPQRYDCVAAVRERTVSCGHAPSAVRATIVGSQNVNVRVASTNVSFDAGTGIFSADVALTNLSTQAMGTADGVNADPAGIRIFFHTGPVTTAGSGAVTVANADGHATFTAADQPYFRYAGILAAGAATDARTWKWKVDPGVEHFAFTLYVDTRLPPVLVITEIMAHPGTADETAGEWFEVYNGGLGPLDLKGWRISSGGDPGHTISTSVIVPARAYVVLGGSADALANGDTPVTYAYADLKLGNGTDDWLAIHTPEGMLADSVSWAAPPGGSASPPPAGASLALDSVAADNLYLGGGAWRAPEGIYGDGGLGSPGRANAQLVFAKVTSGEDTSCGLGADGVAWCWGSNASGWLAATDTTVPDRPTAAPMDQHGLVFRDIAQTYHQTCGVDRTDGIYCVGQDLENFFPKTYRTFTRIGTGAFATISGGIGSVSAICVTSFEGSRFCRGFFGAHFNFKFFPVSEPFVSVAIGDEDVCGLTADGQAYCHGSNFSGELGIGSRDPKGVFTPVVQPAGVRFVAITAGEFFFCALSEQGQAYCWGWGYAGQLGNGTKTDQWVPAPVTQPAGVSFTDIYAGPYQACALTAVGRAYCWGVNDDGQLGDGTRTSRSTPVEVQAPPGMTFSEMALGRYHMCALTSPNDHAVCWGKNDSGQLGDGTRKTRLTPVSVVR